MCVCVCVCGEGGYMFLCIDLIYLTHTCECSVWFMCSGTCVCVCSEDAKTATLTLQSTVDLLLRRFVLNVERHVHLLRFIKGELYSRHTQTHTHTHTHTHRHMADSSGCHRLNMVLVVRAVS